MSISAISGVGATQSMFDVSAHPGTPDEAAMRGALPAVKEWIFTASRRAPARTTDRIRSFYG
jgi:hypothetical protein